MFELIKLFYDITVFKKTPQDVPFSRSFTYTVLAVYALISFLKLVMEQHWSIALLKMIADIILLVIFIRVAVAWVNKSERYLQTLCALLGVDALLTLYSIVPDAVMVVPAANAFPFAVFAMYALTLWQWAVIAHILHHALDQNMGFSLGLALLYVMSVYYLFEIEFPDLMNMLSPQLPVVG